MTRVCVSLENEQKEAATLSVKLQETIESHNVTISILGGDIESNNAMILKQGGVIKKLWEVNKDQSATIETVQEVHKVDFAKIQTLKASLSDLKNANGDLVAECKAAAAEVAEHIPSGDIP